MNDSVWAARPWPWPIPPPSLLFQYWGNSGPGPLADFLTRSATTPSSGKRPGESRVRHAEDGPSAALEKATTPEDLDYILAGDLLNQCISSSFGLRDFRCPSTGSTVPVTMGESLSLASL
ncbi:MAG: hypothetical protein ACLTYN_05685 [Dysosmobacter welbionis]